MTLVRFHAAALLRRFHTCLTSTLQRHDVPASSRSLGTSRPVRHEDKMDLDTWKSVLRSQAPSEERPQGGGGEEPRDTLEAPVEASRKLVDMWRQAGKAVPESLSQEDLETLTELTTKSSKRKYLKYLAIKEGCKRASREKRDRKRAEKLAAAGDPGATPGGDPGADGLEDEGEGRSRNTYLMHFWSRSMDALLGWRAAQAMRHGQALVFDMSYDGHMSRRELENTVSQLMESEGWNRRSPDPFHLHLCNLRPGSAYHRELLKRYGAGPWERLPVTATDRPYTHAFPRESLVYLTADSPNVLRAFDHGKVYVIGAMVDRSIRPGVSLANAKRLDLATARLPLDEYLHWGSGAKNLTLDQVIRILITAKDTGSWEKALGFVPRRKHDGLHRWRRAEDEEDEGARSTKNQPGRNVNAPRETERERGQTPGSPRGPKIPKASGLWSKPSPPAPDPRGKLRVALKSKMEERGKAQGRRNWWEEK